MENNLDLNQKIKNIINTDGLYKIIIIDSDIFKKYSEKEIIEKCRSLDLEMVDNKIGKEVRIIEICDELIKRQSRKLDCIDSKLPLIALKKDVPNFIYERELSQVKNSFEIIMELINNRELAINSQHKICYFVLTKEYESYIKDDVIYISWHDLMNLEIEKIKTIDHIKLYVSSIDEDISLINIIPTYIEIMSPKLKFEIIKEDEQTFILRSNKYEFKVLLILNYNELQNDNINISKYELIIEVEDLKLNMHSILKELNVNAIYKNISKPGKNFRR